MPQVCRPLLRWTWFSVVAAAIGLLLAGAAPAAAQDGGTVAGISIDAVVASLGEDHVATIGSRFSERALAQVVADARAKNLELSVVSVGDRLIKSDAQELAAEVASRVGGTVLVLSPTAGGQYSSQLSSTQQQDARSALLAAGDDDVAAARAYVDSATATGFPWAIVGIVVLIAAVLGAVAFGAWRRHRQREDDDEQLADLASGLSHRLGKLAPQVLGIVPRVEVAGRPDLQERFDRASADYAVLKETLSTPPQNRAEIDRSAASLSDLERRLDVLDRELDALLPGLEPPSPAG